MPNVGLLVRFEPFHEDSGMITKASEGYCLCNLLSSNEMRALAVLVDVVWPSISGKWPIFVSHEGAGEDGMVHTRTIQGAIASRRATLWFIVLLMIHKAAIDVIVQYQSKTMGSGRYVNGATNNGDIQRGKSGFIKTYPSQRPNGHKRTRSIARR